MNIKYVLRETLPPMAWLADVKNGSITVIHGKNLEVKDHFFVEGAWNGCFEKGDFINASWFCGTGGYLDDSTIAFSTPSHVTSGLFTTEAYGKMGGVIVSNSLHFLCAYSGYHLNAQYLNYEIDFNSVLFGINNYRERIHIVNDMGQVVDVRVHYYRTIVVDVYNNVSIEQKKMPEPFNDFKDYKTKLDSAISKMIENAQDPVRIIQYGVVSTISKGYDAPCCASIAHQFGCDTAVTFDAVGKYAHDSGVEIAKAIGFKNIIERDANAYLSGVNLAEAEQLSSGEIGSDLCFVAFDDVFKNNLVFTGDRGDSIWAREHYLCNNEFAFDDTLSHIGFSERKLWIGYISVPMPLFGASQWQSIQRISKSKEMEPWSLHNEYDRPIPRRIVEETGVDRFMFGVKKHGAGITFRYDWGGRLKNRLSEEAKASFERFLQKNKQYRLLQVAKYFWVNRFIYLNRIGIKVSTKMTAREISQVANPTVIRYLIPWASSVIQDRYRKAINI